ncbi:coiled-coil domain-containing protein 40 isoform X4 [Periplaneta americana]|uniref:coiled-coil domain-containing protein 40 isoform X4 n=1 Tax=Periplaneta americana TaxID=6978 RepID=UPI0037E72BF4
MSESGEPESHDNSNRSWPRFRSDRVRNNEVDDEDSQIPQFAHGDEILPHRRNPQTPNRMWRRQGEGDEPEVLEPDHPLMKRFQAALKVHLERQCNRIDEEVLALTAGIKNKTLESEELGVSLYNMQQNVMKQQDLIAKYHETLATLTKLREEMEFQVEASRAVYKSEQQKLNFAQNKEEELHAELESLICLERQFSDWEKEMESELAVSERISEKTKVDKKKLTEEMHKKDCHKKMHEDKLLQKNLEKLCNDKISLEDTILENLQDQITQDKAAKYLNKVLCTLRNKTRDQEIIMMNTENKLTQTGLEVESQKSANEQTNSSLEELKKEVEIEERKLENLEYDLNHSMFEVQKKQCTMDGLLKKLEQLTAKSGAENLNPQEAKISALEKSIMETTEKSEDLQQFWLRQQSHIVQLTNQRNEQLHKINIMRNQVLIMDQKNLKIEHELDCLNKGDKMISRSIATLGNKLLSLNLKLCERKDYKETLDKGNLYTQNQYINILKASELEAVMLKSEIHDIEQEKFQLEESLLGKQRELLAWEKKLQMAQETKKSFECERGKEGDVGAMKSEIHRMQVRYSQLRKAQEKLIGDLEHCVSRRDAIVEQTEARERKTHKGSYNTRQNFQRKLEDIRNKIKHVNSEIKSTDHYIGDVQKRNSELVEQVKSKEEQVQKVQDATKALDIQLEKGQLQKQRNLEVLVRRQRKVRMYNDVKNGRHHLLFRNEHTLDNEMQRLKATNSVLISMVESLLADFPSLKLPLMKIFNTLHLKPA